MKGKKQRERKENWENKEKRWKEQKEYGLEETKIKGEIEKEKQ